MKIETSKDLGDWQNQPSPQISDEERNFANRMPHHDYVVQLVNDYLLEQELKSCDIVPLHSVAKTLLDMITLG